MGLIHQGACMLEDHGLPHKLLVCFTPVPPLPKDTASQPETEKTVSCCINTCIAQERITWGRRNLFSKLYVYSYANRLKHLALKPAGLSILLNSISFPKQAGIQAACWDVPWPILSPKLCLRFVGECWYRPKSSPFLQFSCVENITSVLENMA